MCGKSLGVSSSLNKMAAAASVQDFNVARLFLDALGDIIYSSY